MEIHSWKILATVNGGEMIELLAKIVVLFQIIFGYLREIPIGITFPCSFTFVIILVLMQIVHLYIYRKLRKKNKKLEAKIAFLRSVNSSWGKYFDKKFGPKEDEEWLRILNGNGRK